MSAFSELQNLSLACWPTLLLGLKRRWISKDAISDYASHVLTSGLDNGDTDVLRLVGTDSLTHEEVVTLVNEVCRKQGIDLYQEEHLAIEKWRLSHLCCIQNSSLSKDGKVAALQELYAELDYPEDMADCCIYQQSEISPLAAMHQLIEQLKLKLTKNKQAETPS